MFPLSILVLILVLVSLSIGQTIAIDDAVDAPSIMRFMWITPLQTFNLLGSLLTLEQLMQINQEILAYYDDYQISKANLSNRDTASTKMDNFYHYQQTQDLQFKKCLTQKAKNVHESCENLRPELFSQLLPNLFHGAIKKFIVSLLSLLLLPCCLINVCLNSFLPSFLPSFLSSFLPSLLPSFPPSFLPSFANSYLPSFIHSFMQFNLTDC